MTFQTERHIDCNDYRVDEYPKTINGYIKKCEAVILCKRRTESVRNLLPKEMDEAKVEEIEKNWLEAYTMENFTKFLLKPTLDLIGDEQDKHKVLNIIIKSLKTFHICILIQAVKNGCVDFTKLEKYINEGYFAKFASLTLEELDARTICFFKSDCIKTIDEIDTFFEPLNELPDQSKKDIFNIISVYGGMDQKIQIETLINMVKIFEKNGKGNLLKYYFMLTETGFHIPSEENKNKFFPIWDPEKCFEELNAITTEELYSGIEEEVLGLLKKYIHHNETFLDPAVYPADSKKGGDLKKLCAKIREQYGADTEKIKSIFRLILSKDTHFKIYYMLLETNKEIEENFPGGLKAFLDFYEEIEPFLTFNGDAVEMIINSFSDQIRPPNSTKKVYFKVAKKITKQLRERCSPYFEYESFSPTLRELLENNPEKFEEEMDKIKEFVYKNCNDIGDRKNGADEIILEACLKFFGDPNYENFLKGLAILLKQIKSVMKQIKNQKSIKYDKIGRAIIYFNNLLDYFIETAKGEAENSLKNNYKFDIAAVLAVIINVDGYIPKATGGLNIDSNNPNASAIIAGLLCKEENSKKNFDFLWQIIADTFDARELDPSDELAERLEKNLNLLNDAEQEFKSEDPYVAAG